MVFSRHMQQASHYYENFGFEWSFKYSKILWYLVSYGIQNRAFYMVVKQLPEKNYDILQHYGFVSKL
jgi:hypothetical protein